jgi:beta-galactosidase
MKNIIHCFLLLFICTSFAHAQNAISPREHTSLDADWRFALGHATDASKDYYNGTGYFSYLTKTGYGDGAAAASFDDRAWRKINVPHDWCVALPLSEKGSLSHGFNAIGRNFPENSVGWYRKKIMIPQGDFGKKISLEFEGVYRNSMVWVNGFLLGIEPSGYSSFTYDITDYINYGGENVIAVRADATMEEGWFYEGAGIYRHVWLNKTNPVHVAQNGTFITTTLADKQANVTIRTTLANEQAHESVVTITEEMVDAQSKIIASTTKEGISLKPFERKTIVHSEKLQNPILWDIENPYLHTLRTIITQNGKVIDQYQTPFGIRTVRFDANTGFFLNDKSVKIVGSNMHQDHAGVGVAISDAVNEWRIKQLKSMGHNGIRCSHNPASPAFLDLCDRLGMLVMDENRLMGINDIHLSNVEKLIVRDRNHPSVVIWSLGNEEWAIEGNSKGAYIGKTMQQFAQTLDSSRNFTVAISGGWDNGTGQVMNVMGYNYIVQGDIDEHHKKFPWQAGIGTEESNTVGTRGIYKTEKENAHLAATNRMPENVGLESGWKFYAARPFLAGLFFWTGFDYRGEPTPYGWPAVASQFGLFDVCGFPKDISFYTKAWWNSKTPMIHLGTHWNWGKSAKDSTINFNVYSNCDEVELFLNKKSLGKKSLAINDHLAWSVKFQAGTLMAQGYVKGKLVVTEKLVTTDVPNAVNLMADKISMTSSLNDAAVITVTALDVNKNNVPTANNEIKYTITGPAKIVGVGNGDPASHEPDQFHEVIVTTNVKNLNEKEIPSLVNTIPITNEKDWKPAFWTYQDRDNWQEKVAPYVVIRGSFELPDDFTKSLVTLFNKSTLDSQTVFINGQKIANFLTKNQANDAFELDKTLLKSGNNEYVITGKRIKKQSQWAFINTDTGVFQIKYEAPQYKRRLFNGLGQVIIQPTGEKGEVSITAAADGLQPMTLKISTK